jgi:hypothetical protein
VTYEVFAQVHGSGTDFVRVLMTPDEAYAQATLEQMKEAGVRARIDTLKDKKIGNAS